MTDDKNKTDYRDRTRVSAEEKYELQMFAQEAGISVDQARDLISRFGNDRDRLMREAGVMVKQIR